MTRRLDFEGSVLSRTIDAACTARRIIRRAVFFGGKSGLSVRLQKSLDIPPGGGVILIEKNDAAPGGCKKRGIGKGAGV